MTGTSKGKPQSIQFTCGINTNHLKHPDCMELDKYLNQTVSSKKLPNDIYLANCSFSIMRILVTKEVLSNIHFQSWWYCMVPIWESDKQFSSFTIVYFLTHFAFVHHKCKCFKKKKLPLSKNYEIDEKQIPMYIQILHAHKHTHTYSLSFITHTQSLQSQIKTNMSETLTRTRNSKFTNLISLTFTCVSLFLLFIHQIKSKKMI